MKKIIKMGQLPEPQILNFKCDRCNTEFKTDEWSFIHEPRTYGEPKSENGCVHTICPLCKHFITVRTHGS